jgi:hypothetical protein
MSSDGANPLLYGKTVKFTLLVKVPAGVVTVTGSAVAPAGIQRKSETVHPFVAARNLLHYLTSCFELVPVD